MAESDSSIFLPPTNVREVLTFLIGVAERTQGAEVSHHLERSPVEPDLCMGCWTGCIEVHKFLLRATGHSFWSLPVQEAMVSLVEMARAGKLNVLQPSTTIEKVAERKP